MSNEIKGKIKLIEDRQDFPSGFYKQVIRIETDDKYPQVIPVEFKKDKCDMLVGLNEGDTVTVQYNLEGREWNDGCFVNVSGWKLDRDENGAEGVQGGAGGVTGSGVVSSAADEDDVPF